MKPAQLSFSNDLVIQLDMIDTVVIPHIIIICRMHEELLARVSTNHSSSSISNPLRPNIKAQPYQSYILPIVLADILGVNG